MKAREKRDWKRIFLALLVAFAVISFWRGLWGLWDLYIFPDNYLLSLWVSVVVGVLILVVSHRAISQFLYK